MSNCAYLPSGEQKTLNQSPYDTWLQADGSVAAEFYREGADYRLRFPDQADFIIDGATLEARCIACPDCPREVCENLYWNAVLPLVGNHLGSLFIHGSAVSVDGRAAAFLGQSRRGKTTLAGAFARAGHPFLSEDAVALEPDEAGYTVRPTRPVLRLFGDSARALVGSVGDLQIHDGKQVVSAGTALPFAGEPAQLGKIFVLGPGEADRVTIRDCSPREAFQQLMQHAFVLDIADKKRLRGHFDRLGTLAETAPFATLDYPRVFDQLPTVVDTITQHLKGI